MVTPKRYVYRKSWMNLLGNVVFFGLGAWFLHYIGKHPEQTPGIVPAIFGKEGAEKVFLFAAIGSASMAALALLQLIMQALWGRKLDVLTDTIVAPQGFFMRRRRIYIPHVKKIWDSGDEKKGEVLHLSTDQGDFKILELNFKDSQCFSEVRHYIRKHPNLVAKVV